MHFDFATSMTLYVLHEVSVHFKKNPSNVEALQRKNENLARETQAAANRLEVGID